jgi:hypothetical protein
LYAKAGRRSALPLSATLLSWQLVAPVVQTASAMMFLLASAPASTGFPRRRERPRKKFGGGDSITRRRGVGCAISTITFAYGTQFLLGSRRALI